MVLTGQIMFHWLPFKFEKLPKKQPKMRNETLHRQNGNEH